MPGRSAGAAREAFLEPLRRALSCVTDAQLFTSGGKRPGADEALVLSADPLPLRSRAGDLQLVLGQRFRLVQEGRKQWHVSTVAYDYRLNDRGGRELISWHWHPSPLPGPDFPHLHAAAGRLGRHAHLPTGRVSIESILRLLLDDLDVRPTRQHADNWAGVLDACEGPFIKHRRWHA